MRTLALSAIVAGIVAGLVVSLTAPPASYDAAGHDVQDRLAVLEGRLARLEPHPAAPLLRSRAPAGAPSDVAARLGKLEERVARLGPASAARPAAADDPPAASKAPAERAAPAEDAARRDPTTRRRTQSLYDKAMQERGAGRHKHEEALLREVIESAGPDAEIAKEAAYQIGWSRSSAGDHVGAREAWLAARDRYDRGHWRRDYARFYAASSAVKAQDPVAAQRELDDLIRDIVADRSEHAQRQTILERSRRLLASLRE